MKAFSAISTWVPGRKETIFNVFDLIRTQKYYETEELALTEDNLKEIKRKVMAEILVKHAAFFEPLETSSEKPGHTLRLIRKEKEVGWSKTHPKKEFQIGLNTKKRGFLPWSPQVRNLCPYTRFQVAIFKR